MFQNWIKFLLLKYEICWFSAEKLCDSTPVKFQRKWIKNNRDKYQWQIFPILNKFEMVYLNVNDVLESL